MPPRISEDFRREADDLEGGLKWMAMKARARVLEVV
jgi:hypothetical protein